MKKGILRGTVLGILAGAVAGLLLAPKSGKETQADIKRRVRGAADDMTARLTALSNEVSGRVDTLKEAAKDLKGEAREESQELIRRAEVLKQDLRISSTNLAKNGTKTGDEAMKNVKLLLAEGAEVMRELERVTKTLAGSAKTKADDVKRGGRPNNDGTPDLSDAGEAARRQDDLSDEIRGDK